MNARWWPGFLAVGLALSACPTADDDDSGAVDDDDIAPDDDDSAAEDDDDSVAQDDDDAAPPVGVVYVTVAGHLEDQPGYANCTQYPGFRDQMLAFADVLAAEGVPFNLQVEYEFLFGASNCETPEMQVATGGTNVVDHFVQHYGWEIDPHQEGGWEKGLDNYADVHHLGSQLTTMSEVVGGFKWDDPAQIDMLEAGEAGWLTPDYTWSPDILTLAVGTQHHLGDFSDDDLTSGVWKPAGGLDDFLTHDPGRRMTYVAPGLQHQNWGDNPDCAFHDTAEYVQVLLDYMAEGRIDGTKIHTATIALPQQVMLQPENHPEVVGLIDGLDGFVADGTVQFATYTEVVEIWETTHGGEPSAFTFDQIDPDDYTCP